MVRASKNSGGIVDLLHWFWYFFQMMPGGMGMPMGGGGGRAPMLVLNPNTKREGEDGHKVQTQNVGAAKVPNIYYQLCTVTVFDVVLVS